MNLIIEPTDISKIFFILWINNYYELVCFDNDTYGTLYVYAYGESLNLISKSIYENCLNWVCKIVKSSGRQKIKIFNNRHTLTNRNDLLSLSCATMIYLLSHMSLTNTI